MVGAVLVLWRLKQKMMEKQLSPDDKSAHNNLDFRTKEEKHLKVFAKILWNISRIKKYFQNKKYREIFPDSKIYPESKVFPESKISWKISRITMFAETS